ncbi:MAG: META domain-containing protein [Gemmatimonadota bacterium]|nr:META domain-containing protein [Gemmatimonadota bacterium]
MRTKRPPRGLAAPAVFVCFALGAAGCDAPPDPTSEEHLRQGTYLAQDGTAIQLVDGEREAEAPGGVSYRLLRTARGDLDLDGEEDAAAVLVERRGSQELLRLHALVADGESLEDVAVRLLGDRIVLSDLRVDEGLIHAELVVRRPGDPVTVEPSLPISTTFVLTTRGLIPTSAAERSGAGESGPRGEPAEGAGLASHEWELAAFEMGDWTADLAPFDRRPTLRFDPELADPGGISGRLTGFTGCNQLFGSFRAEPETTLRFSGLGITRRACTGDVADLEQRLVSAYESVESYALSDDGLVIDFVGGTLRFTAGAPRARPGPGGDPADDPGPGEGREASAGRT